MQLGRCRRNIAQWRQISGHAAIETATPSATRQREILGRSGDIFQRPRRRPTMSVGDFLIAYRHLPPGQVLTDQTVTLNGRVVRRRDSGRSLFFLDLDCGLDVLQIKCSKTEFAGAESFEIGRSLAIGDHVSVTGLPSSTAKGQLLLRANTLQVTAPCQHRIPNALTSPEIRQRQRYLDMIVHPDTRARFVTRSKIISYIRQFLDGESFLEVETPVLWSSAGGANANPFVTHGSAIKSDLHLRIAPELFLKQLIVGGLERVYEIGKVFRNEGMDREHHPEFTSVEFYMAHSDYTDLIPFTESLLCGLSDSLAIAASYRFSGQFDKIDVVDCLEAELSSALGATVSLTGLLTDDVSARDELQRLARHCGLDVSSVASSSALLGTMISSLVEPRCHRPTFLMNHPTLISPLAKSHPTRPELAERFELFVNGQELCNSYSELADPNEQRLRFKQQMALRTAGDSEARPPDEEFCVALEYGMPPTAGWGLGIDRLVKLMTGAVHIRDVLLFPALRPKSHSVS